MLDSAGNFRQKFRSKRDAFFSSNFLIFEGFDQICKEKILLELILFFAKVKFLPVKFLVRSLTLVNKVSELFFFNLKCIACSLGMDPRGSGRHGPLLELSGRCHMGGGTIQLHKCQNSLKHV